MQPAVLRLLRFRPTSPSIDARLRTHVIPQLARRPGMLVAVAGRAGPGTEGTRLLASMWSSAEAMDDALCGDEEADGLPGLEGLVADAHADTLAVAFSLALEGTADAGILRLVRGTTRADALDTYVREAADGTQADRIAGIGPRVLYLAVDPPDRFATLSVWDEWGHVEAATGADLGSVERTRHAELLATWSAEHYEVIPGTVIASPAHAERQPA